MNQIGKCIMDTALDDIFIDSGRVLLLNPEKHIYECLTAVPKEIDATKPEAAIERVAISEPLPADDPLLQRIAERKDQVT